MDELQIKIKNLIPVPKINRNQKHENIFESKAYLSNQPNISNKIGNGAKIFELANIPGEKYLPNDPF
jgi:hypothetical protein